MKGRSGKGTEAKVRILRAAADLFHKQGCRATSPDQVIEVSATGKGQFYHYFRSKAGLIHEVLQAHLAAVKTGSAGIHYEITSWRDLETWFLAHVEAQRRFGMTRGCPFGWIMLAIMLGLIAAESVWFWFSGPLWSSAFRFECGVLGFSPDSREVLIVDGLFATVPNGPSPRLIRCDSSTGKILSVVDLPYPGPTDLMCLQISPDAATLLIRVIGPEDPADLNGDRPLVYYLHDTRTAFKLAGPIKLNYLDRLNFSPDSQWFWIHHGDAPYRFDVIKTCTGKTILQLREHDDAEPCGLCFASDSSAVIVLWRRTPRNAAESNFLQILDVPKGKERHRFQLPARTWEQVDKSVGKRIYLKAAGGTAPKYFMKTYSLELAADSISEEKEEPLLITYHGERGDEVHYSEEGPGWLAQISSGSYQKTRSDELLDWVAQKTGRALDGRSGTHVRIRFLNPETGQLRYELPKQLKFPFRISPDGRRVVSKYSDSAVEAWATDPAPRWPWSIAAGSATVGVVLLFGRWRKRRGREQFP